MSKNDTFKIAAPAKTSFKLMLGTLAVALCASTLAGAQATAATPPTPAECGIPGHHALLERMTDAFGLNCDQERKLEPLLHKEESVSKPLLRFQGFTPQEKKDVMQEVKVAARRQILPLLTPQQQVKMQQEIETVADGGEGLHGQGGHHKHGGHGTKKAKKVEAPVDPFTAEESLSEAIENYAALSSEQKKDLVLKVKKASLRPDAPQLSPDQTKKVDQDIQQLSQNS